MDSYNKLKEIRERNNRRGDSIKTLVGFLKNLSAEWEAEEDLDNFRRLSSWYINEFHRKNKVNLEKDHIVGFCDAVLLHTLSLWQDVHSLCPLIHEFNMRTLESASDGCVLLLLPQLLMSLRFTRDKVALENIVLRCVKEFESTSRLFWTLVVETEREGIFKAASGDNYFARLIYSFMKKLSLEKSDYRQSLRLEGRLVEKLVKISGIVRQSRVSSQQKKSLLRKILWQEEHDALLFDPVSFPLDPNVTVVGLIPDECSVFQSQLNPLLLTFLTKDGQMKKCIFKSGDDLRQDAIVIQMLSIVKMVLSNNGIGTENVITYKVLSTGLEHGFVEYIPSDSLDNLLQHEKGLGKYLYGSDGISPDNEKMKRFVDGLAFYTVMTYVLCVGDRHLDNILMTEHGHVFHIDYGFVGREPKPFAPAVKLCPEMIDIMGGKFSGYYGTFMKKCVAIFLVLRKNCNVVLDPLALMVDAGVNDINVVTVDKIKRRFMLDMTDQDAMLILTGDIEKGFETILPKMMDNFHHTWKVVQSGSLLQKRSAEDDEWLYI
jgi:phosphatidylinositol 3-kinase